MRAIKGRSLQMAVCLGLLPLGGMVGGVKGAIATGKATPSQQVAQARPPASPPQFIRPETACPETPEALTPLLLRDLPAYANRVSQRSFGRRRTATRPGTVILAGRPEFEPLTLGPGIYASGLPEDSPPQIFFTTLERQYVGGRSVSIQNFHWVFLVRTTQGWQLAMMFSQVGGFPADEPPTPPQDSSYGVTAQAIRLWLRDCRTGNVAPLAAPV